jgi:hypothetical protein
MKKRVAVFGRSDVQRGSPPYEQAREVGRLLAENGIVVLNGGYEGAMEASSLGAYQAGGQSEGVVCRAFSERTPNPYLSRCIWTSDLFDRTRVLYERADGYIALEPRTGTLWEVVGLWALAKAGLGRDKRLVLLGATWDRIAVSLDRGGIVERNLLKWTISVRDAREAVNTVIEDFKTVQRNYAPKRKRTP